MHFAVHSFSLHFAVQFWNAAAKQALLQSSFASAVLWCIVVVLVLRSTDALCSAALCMIALLIEHLAVLKQRKNTSHTSQCISVSLHFTVQFWNAAAKQSLLQSSFASEVLWCIVVVLVLQSTDALCSAFGCKTQNSMATYTFCTHPCLFERKVFAALQFGLWCLLQSSDTAAKQFQLVRCNFKLCNYSCGSDPAWPWWLNLGWINFATTKCLILWNTLDCMDWFMLLRTCAAKHTDMHSLQFWFSSVSTMCHSLHVATMMYLISDHDVCIYFYFEPSDLAADRPQTFTHHSRHNPCTKPDFNHHRIYYWSQIKGNSKPCRQKIELTNRSATTHGWQIATANRSGSCTCLCNTCWNCWGTLCIGSSWCTNWTLRGWLVKLLIL